MNKNGHVSIQGEALGDLGYKSEKIWYPPTLSTWWLDVEGARVIEKINEALKIEKIDIPSSFRTKDIFV